MINYNHLWHTDDGKGNDGKGFPHTQKRLLQEGVDMQALSLANITCEHRIKCFHLEQQAWTIFKQSLW
jgi:hypothetical protein